MRRPAGKHTQSHRFAALIEAGHTGRIRLATLREGEYPHPGLTQILAGVDNIGFWDARTDQDWGIPEHRNVGIELSFLETGSLTYFVDGKPYRMHPGDLTITRPWQSHSAGNPGLNAGRMYWFILGVGALRPHERWQWPPWLVLSQSDLRDLTNLLRHNEQPVLAATAEVGSCFGRIGKLIAHPDQTSTAVSRLTILLNELFVCVLDMLRGHALPQTPSLATAQRTVEMLLEDVGKRLDEPWTLDLMVKKTGLKRTRLTYYCRRLTSRTPMEHLAHLRVEQAKKMLRETKVPMTEIALACGFASSQYFATTFRRMERVAPRDFRSSASAATRGR